MYIKGDYFILNTKNIIVRVQDVELRFWQYNYNGANSLNGNKGLKQSGTVF